MPLKVMHFGPEDDKQNYNYFGNKSSLLLSEPIMATVILYLSNVSRGGQILFPESDVREKLCVLYYSYVVVARL